MSLAVMVFVLFAVLLIGLLSWALRPAKRWSNPAQDVFKLLSQPRHCMHIPHILHALQPEDTEFLKEDGQTELMHAVRRQRRRIALEYLNQLQEEFEMLLEVSRALAVMAPEVVTMQEMERWKLSLGFALNCTLLRLRLRCGLQPLEGFHLLSGMAIDMLRNLDAATSRIAEVAVGGVGLPGGGANESSDH